MFQFLSKFLPRRSRRARPSRARAQRLRVRPGVEALEDRAVPALLGSELHINTFVPHNQYEVDTASSAAVNGGSVHVWTQTGLGFAGNTDIWARIYDGAGQPVGVDFPVATHPLWPDYQPSVAMSNGGGFIVVWTQLEAGFLYVRGQLFTANGDPTGVAFPMSIGPDAYDPSVAMDSDGNFVVSYTRRVTPTNRNVYAQRFQNDGTLLGPEINVATSGDNEYSSSVARAADGRFAIAYQRDVGGVNSNIHLRRYTSGGAVIACLIPCLSGAGSIAVTADNERDPEVAMDSSGNVIVVYRRVSGGNSDILARRVSNMGVLGPIIAVDDDPAVNHYNPSVALANDGRFVVAYEESGQNVLVREMGADDSVVDTFYLVQDSTNGYGPSIALNGSDVYFVTYTVFDSPAEDKWGIFGWRGQL